MSEGVKEFPASGSTEWTKEAMDLIEQYLKEYRVNIWRRAAEVAVHQGHPAIDEECINAAIPLAAKDLQDVHPSNIVIKQNPSVEAAP